jgi:hypothetical protein
MANEKQENPRTQPSAPVKAPSTTNDPSEPESERMPRREAGDESGTRGDRMPKGADEPGAGL